MTHRASPTSAPAAVPAAAEIATVQHEIIDWFDLHARDLPWRRPSTTPWGVLVSEVMSQQTPMSRVAPRWSAWMAAWPTPAALAAASPAEVLLAWDTLGYPRRALRLQECARVVTAEHAGRLPDTEAELLALPGIGAYTAAAVASFAYGQHTAVLDVNVRRVLSRLFAGVAHPAPALSKTEARWAAAFIPTEGHVAFNAGAMELGALVCTSRNPKCGECPVADHCAWLAAGKPEAPQNKKKTQAWHGTDRQLRGTIMRALRAAHGHQITIPAALLSAPATRLDVDALDALPSDVQRAVMHVRELGTTDRVERLIADLVHDGLAAKDETWNLALPDGS